MVVAGEVERHLLGRLEVEVVGVELPALRVLERVAGLDAEQRLVRARVLVAEVVDVAGRDEPEPGALGHLRKERVNSLLRLEVRVLHLDVGRVLAEDLDEPVHLGRRVGGPGLLERLADPPGEAAGERDQPLGVGLEQLPVDARLVVVALEVAGRGELDQVGVAGVVLGEEREVSVPLGLGAAVVADVDLAAENRLDSDLSGLPVELDGAGERAVVGEPDGGHLELSGASREGRDAARPVEDRVLGVDVKVDERRFRHGQPILVLAEDRTRERQESGDLTTSAGLGIRILRDCLPMETPVHLTAVGSQTEADIICSLLRENGIKCGDRPTDVAIQGMGGSGGWREILVSEEQLEAARELLPTTPPAD